MITLFGPLGNDQFWNFVFHRWLLGPLEGPKTNFPKETTDFSDQENSELTLDTKLGK